MKYFSRPMLSNLRGAVLLIVGLLFCGIFLGPFIGWHALAWLFGPRSCRIKVWVKVVDQYDEAIEGYSLKIRGWKGGMFVIGNEEVSAWVKSNSKGLICYDSGKPVTRLFFGDVLSELNGGGNINYLPSLDNVTLSCADIYNDNDADYGRKWDGMGSDPSHPLIVRVYKHGPPQKLVRGEITVRAERPQLAYLSLDVLKGKVWESSDPEGDIAFGWTSAEENSKIAGGQRRPGGGLEVMAGKGAGLASVRDRYRITPPVNGYQSKLVYPRDESETAIQLGRYVAYFYCRNKMVYGCIKWSYPNRFFYLLNVNGQRNLYYEGYPSLDSVVMKGYIRPPVEDDVLKENEANGDR